MKFLREGAYSKGNHRRSERISKRACPSLLDEPQNGWHPGAALSLRPRRCCDRDSIHGGANVQSSESRHEIALFSNPAFAPSAPAATETSQVKWPPETFRRLLMDLHVPDWDALLTEFNAADYAGSIARGGFQPLMQDACSTVGLALWRTRVSQMPAGRKGRDYGRRVAMNGRRRMNARRIRPSELQCLAAEFRDVLPWEDADA